MIYKKFVATAFLAVAATTVAAGTSTAAPAAVEQAQSAQGQAQGVDYTLKSSESGKELLAEVTGGAFSMDAEGKVVTLKNGAGAVVAEFPLAGPSGVQAVSARIENDGQQLALSPAVAPSEAKDISAGSDWFWRELQRSAVGGIVGAILGAFLFGIGAFPGALIGLLVVGGQPLVDSGSAALRGE
ncbi:hypothetical protein [Nocardia yamanashiensis]|uniref:hypothetical protein n=1 Tax=Nocardia yamanashiensis TaxID=209247 RepID=UPI0008335777|nr:hypothetical protein [Nocardia yamanashiensis]